MDNRFVIWATGNPVAHIESAWQAWSEQQREIDALHAQIIEMQARAEHLEQRCFEAESRLPRLKLVSAA